MKKVIFCIATIVIASCAQRCTKLNEDQYNENIERPQVDIEVPLPEWSETPQTENDMIFDLNK